MINKEIMEVFDSLGIPCFYMEAPKTTSNKYALFSIFKEQEIGVYDNEAKKVVYYITINYWCKSPQDTIKYTEIKRALKNAKMIVRDVVDIPPHNGYYGKSFSVKVTRLIEN